MAQLTPKPGFIFTPVPSKEALLETLRNQGGECRLRDIPLPVGLSQEE